MTFFLQQTLNGIALGSVFALFALGFSLVLANLKVFHVAHAAIFTWGAVICWHLTDGWGWPFLAALPATAVLAGLLNVAAYLVLVRHLEDRRNKELAAFISSLGGLIVLAELAAIDLDRKDVRLPFDIFPIDTWEVGSVRVTSIQLLMIGTALVTFLLLHWVVERTEVGRQIQAVAYDREVASMLGVDATRISALVFFISGAIGGAGACLVAIAFNVINSDLGGAYMVLAIAVMVIGGFGSVKGAFVAGGIVGLTASLTTGYLTSSYREVVIFGLLLLFLVVRPTGLFRTNDAGARA